MILLSHLLQCRANWYAVIVKALVVITQNASQKIFSDR
jgi:hypothetical protein